MDKILQYLGRIEKALGRMLDEGIAEPLIDELNRQVRKGLRWARRELRGRIGQPDAETRKWLATAMIVIQAARAWILLRS